MMQAWRGSTEEEGTEDEARNPSRKRFRSLAHDGTTAQRHTEPAAKEYSTPNQCHEDTPTMRTRTRGWYKTSCLPRRAAKRISLSPDISPEASYVWPAIPFPTSSSNPTLLQSPTTAVGSAFLPLRGNITTPRPPSHFRPIRTLWTLLTYTRMLAPSSANMMASLSRGNRTMAARTTCTTPSKAGWTGR